MTYQGERARLAASEMGRFFEVSKVRVGADGHISEVLWTEVASGSDQDVGPRVRASAAEVVDAIHDGALVAAVFPPSKADHAGLLPERTFVVIEHDDGSECIAFADTPSAGRNLSDMDSLDD